MKIKFIYVTIDNLKTKEVKLRLPMENTKLQKTLIVKEITKENQSKIEHLNNPMKSVKDTELRNFNIEKPTNIYYLNSYFDILKSKNMDLPEDKIDITTDKLKEMIADLLDIEDKNLTLEEMFKEDNNKEADVKKEKPRFSIKELQKRHMERKAKNGK